MTTGRHRRRTGDPGPARTQDGYKNKTFRIRRTLAESAERRSHDVSCSLNEVVEEALERFVGGGSRDLETDVREFFARIRRRRTGRAPPPARPVPRERLYER